MSYTVIEAPRANQKPVAQPTMGGSVYVKPQDIAWEPTQFEGISIKVLYEDTPKGEMTCLLKWQPGATLPMHKHPEIEQTFVIEGSFYDHDGVCREVSLRQRVRAPAREGYNQLPPIGTPTIAFVQRFL